jgi:cytochrome P450
MMPSIMLPSPPQAKGEVAQDLLSLPGPRGLPLIGNILELDRERVHCTLEDWARRYGDVYRLRLGPKRMLIVSDLDLIQTILRDRPNGFRRLRLIEEVFSDLNAEGVFSAEGQRWARQRRLVMAAFSSNHLRACHDQIVTITRRLERLFHKAADRGEPVDVLRELMRYSVDVTSVVAFGVDMNTLEQGAHVLQRHMEPIFSMVQRRLNAPFPYWRYVKLPADRAVERGLVELERVILGLIRDARERLERDPAGAPRNLLEALLLSRDAEDPGARLSDREVYGNTVTFLLGGQDTTADTLAWILYFVSKHRDMQARMHAEVVAELGPNDLPMSLEESQKLRYAAAVAQEALRLKSPGPYIFLEAVNDTVIKGVAVPAGTGVVLLTRFVALADKSFQNASTFDPARWLLPSPTPNAHDPRAALAFGGGPRLCPGRALALLECNMVSAMVARNFDVSLFGRDTVQERSRYTMEPQNLRIRFAPREAKSSAERA